MSGWDKGSQTGLVIQRLPQGGFVVSAEYKRDFLAEFHFACTTIDEALRFVRDALNPIPFTSARSGDDFDQTIRRAMELTERK